jgi:intracellular multiplication protein IcmE
MAGKKENIKSLFSNTRSRVIIIITALLMLLMVTIGYYKFKGPSIPRVGGASLSSGPGGIQSIPGAINPTAQYASLQEKQNLEQAKKASKTGSSAIPTIVRSQSFGAGIEAVGPQGGKGALGFSALSRDDLSGPQQSLWLQKLKDGNCSKASVDAVLQQGAGLADLKGACTCAQLKDNGYTLSELKSVCTCPDLKGAGFNASQLKSSGLTAEELRRCEFDACEMRAAGFNAQEMKDAGYSNGEMKGAGYPATEIEKSGLPEGITEADLLKAGCNADALERLRKAGVSAAEIRRVSGCTAAQLKAAGYTAKQLKNAGFTAAELRRAGFSPQQLRDAGFAQTTPLQVNGRAINCSPASLEAAHAAGVSPTEIREKLGCSAAALRAAGYTRDQLKNAGYTDAELAKAGFPAGVPSGRVSEAQIRAAGCSASALRQLREEGVSAAEIKRVNSCTNAELMAAGYPDQKSVLEGLSVPTQGAGVASVAAIPSLLPQHESQATKAAANEARLKKILERQKLQMADQQYQQKIQQKAGAMTGAANQALQGWKTGFTQVYVGGNKPDAKGAGQTVTAVHEGPADHAALEKNAHGPHGPAGPPAISAGEVLFAVLDTSVNSDQPGPILATIVSGRYNGAKLIGSFTKPDNADKLVISFNMMSVPGANRTIAINAYAIDPNTARTALSSKVDHHYLLRYGALFASTFMEGFGNAFQSAGTTVTIGGTGGVTTTTVSNGVGRSVLENAVIGLATVGKNWGQVAMKQVNTPVTVEVYSGSGLGVLFTQDVA